MQDVYVQLRTRSKNGVAHAASTIEQLGGKVLHAYPPIAIIASLPQENVAKLTNQLTTASIRTEPFSAKTVKSAEHQARFAMWAWNGRIQSMNRGLVVASPKKVELWNAPGRQPPHPPRETTEQLRRREMELFPQRSANAPGALAGPSLSIPVLVGTIGVGLVFVDSIHEKFQFMDEEKCRIVADVGRGLNLFTTWEPRASIKWEYNIKEVKISLDAAAFAGIDQDSYEDLWRGAAMEGLGYTNDINGLKRYTQTIRDESRFGVSWAFLIFITKYPKIWWAYKFLNHIVLDLVLGNWSIDDYHLVVAHETGHIFGCPDEYDNVDNPCSCTSRHGRHSVENGNCQNCGRNFVPCLMAANTPTVCNYTRGHLGWHQLDADL